MARTKLSLRQPHQALEALNEPEHRHEAADLIRGLIDKIVLTPKEDDSGLYIDLKGDLAGILNMATGNKSPAEKRQIIEQMESISEELKITEDSSRNTLNNNGKVHVQDKLVAGAHNHLWHIYNAPNFFKHRKVHKNKSIAA